MTYAYNELESPKCFSQALSLEYVEQIGWLLLSGIVHTRSESPQGLLRNMWTCGIILASAYILCHLTAI